MVEASRRRRRRRRRKRRKRREEEEEEDGEDEEEEDGEDVEGKVVLPNVGSLHLLQHPPAPLSLHLAGSGAALQVAFTLQHSPCHESLFVNRSDPRGWVAVGAGAGEVMQCEWLITAPRGTHVKVTVERLNLPDEENDEDEENGGETRGYNNTAEGDERQKNNIQTDEKEETFEQEGKGRGRGKHKNTLESYLCVNEAGDASFPSASTRVLQGGGRRTVPLVFVSLQHSLRIAFQGAANTSLRLRYQLYECEDDNSECQYWAAEGECVANPRWMAPHCRRACQQCDFSTTCEDQHSNCAFWSTHNQCEENKLWMAVHCSRSCGYCDVCGDSNRRCGRWAREGECEANGEYMRVFCPLSCGVCEPTNTTTTTTTTPAPPTTTTTTTTIIPRPSTRRRGGGKKRVSQVYEDNETTGGISRHPKIRKNGKRLKNPRLFKAGRTKTRKTGRRVTENSLLVTHTSPRGQENENRGLKSKESKDNKGDSSILVPRKKTDTSRREENEEDEEERKNEEAEEEVKENHEEKENEGKEGEEEEKSNEEMKIEEEDIRNREEKENDQNKELKEIEGEEEEEEETKERQEIEKEINREEKEEDNKNEEEMREAEDTTVHSSTQLSYSDQNSLTSGNEDIHMVVLKKDGKYLKNLFRNQQKGNEGTREVEENEVTERKATTERTRENGIIAGKRENEILRGNGEGSEGIEESGINLRERKEMQITEEKEGRKRRKINNWRRRRRRNRRKNQRRKGREWRDGGNDPQTRRRKEGKYQGGGRRGEGRRWRKSRRGKKGRKTGDRRREDEREFYVTASPATTTTTTTTTTISTSILTLPPPASTHSTPIPSQIISTSPKLGTRTHHKHSHRRYRNRFHRHHRDRQGKTPIPKGRRGPKPHSGTPKTPPGNVETQQEANEIREAGKNTSETSQKTEIPDWVTVGFSRNDVQESEGVFQVTPRSRSDLGRSGSERGRGVNEWRRSERGHDGEKRRDEKGQLGSGTERRTAEDIRQNVERSYAEWGIGPTRPVHRPRLSPSWRFRKGFYRRGKHVYEDDHP